ncbi:uncharacterized protein LOC106766119 [Vigna radiata var. radiata]|uniref:Uncharacterized protein LOC106766119 n=1 Tax=Vigna radiata var. radiata TaxID=3916 RepID=A0A1S3UK00_VIGRR|nr:uncharacterized protein LOC106766119 [Vigna radiata var. radiata]
MARMFQSSMPVFDGKDYEDWCVKMDAILGFQEIDDIVNIGFKEPTKSDSEETKKVYRDNKKLDCKARMILHQCVSATIFQKISKATTAEEAWDILQDGYGNSGKVKKVRLQSLQRQYELLCTGEQETIKAYIGRIQVVVNAMRACDKVVKEKKIVAKILRTLPPQFDHIVVAIEESKDTEKMKVEELRNSLEAHEQHLAKRKIAEMNTTENTALQARSNQNYKTRGTGRGRGKFRGGRGGRNGGRYSNSSEHIKDDNSGDQREGNYRGRGGRKHTDKRNVQCFTCNKFGHYSSECWHNENAKKETNEEANLVKEELESDSDIVLLMTISGNNDKERTAQNRHVQKINSVGDECAEKVGETEYVSLAGQTFHAKEEDTTWYLDTGYSNHVTGNRRWLLDLDTSMKGTIHFADNRYIKAEGSGKVMITRKNGRPVFIHNVWYVPTIKNNLLSLGQVHEKGFTMKMQHRHIEVFDERQ